MRRLWCKGKSVQDGSWMHGYYCEMNKTTYAFEKDYKTHPVKVYHLIAQDSMTDWGLPNKLQLYEVDPETVGMYTGKEDRNAKRIYEGDILRDGRTGEIVSVWWNEHRCCFECRGGSVYPVQVGSLNKRSIIIGNIHDNPDMVKNIDVDQSVKWNQEQVRLNNEKYQEEVVRLNKEKNKCRDAVYADIYLKISDEIGYGLTRDKAIAIWNHVWEHGHSAGISDVLNCLYELMDLIRDVLADEGGGSE